MRKFDSIPVVLAASAAILATASPLRAANVTWDAANNNWTSTTLGGQAWADYDSAIFSTAGDHTITVGAGVLVGKPTGANGTVMNITTGNYTFSGSGLTFRNADAVGGGDMDFNFANNTTTTFNVGLTSLNNAGNFRLRPTGSGAVVNLNGGYSATYQVSLGSFSPSTFNLGGGATYASATMTAAAGNVNVGNAVVNATNFQMFNGNFTVNNASADVNFTQNGSAAVLVGQSNSADQRFILQNGTVDVGTTTDGGVIIVNANSITESHNGIGRLDVSGGRLTARGDISLFRAATLNGRGDARYIQSAGVVTTRGLVTNTGANAVGASAVGSITITGGELYIGANGIQKTANGPSTVTTTISGGTIGATASWSSNMDMTLATTNGNITFKAANEAGDTPSDITLNGVLSGAGGLTKTGAGVLTLGGLNTYTGDTLVSAGEFVLADGAQMVFNIGLTGVNNSVTGTGSADFDGTFVFNLLDPLATSGTWVIADVVSQNFGGTFSVDGWTPAGDTFTFNNYVFDTNTGVLTAVPEPSAYALTGVLMLGLAALRARRRRR